MPLKNDRFIRALLRQPVDRTPVWVMRQAGRYLPEYRATRAEAGSFIKLMKNPELACEVTLQPLRRYPLDAAILFSDILTIPDAMGCELDFATGEGPFFHKPINTVADIKALGVPDPEATMPYVTDAVRLIKRELNDEIPLIGFSGSPWTLATYMVEGRGSKNFSKVKAMMYNEPAAMTQLLDVLVDAIAEYLNAQIAAGVNAVQIFDTWGGTLTTSAYREFSLDPMARIIAKLNRERTLADGTVEKIPVIVFTKGGGHWLELIADSGCDAAGTDWTIELADARARVGDRIALQGNLDPSALYAKPEKIRQQVAHVLASFGHGSGHVFNLGHGITPEVDPECMGAMIAAVQELSVDFH